MDVKAMARSKRSHTKHHQPKKPHRPKPPSTSSSSSPSSNDPKVVKEGERKRSSLGNSLPSNWDRYDDSEEDDEIFGSDSESAGGSAPDAAKTDVVKPKSKGADFGFLISQAKSQSPSDLSASFDDILPDLSEGLESMLSVRGENVLSWTGGDNFLMEDEATTSQEAQFFTLNLQTLAEELARIDLAQRLFIEEDILPPELRVPQKIETNFEMPVSATGKQSSEADDLVFQDSSEVEKWTVNQEVHSLRSDTVDTMDPTPTPSSFRQEGQWDDVVADQESDFFRANQEAELGKRLPKFEAGAAEAELDMLLDSFNETKLFDSSNVDRKVQSAFVKKETSTSSFSRGESLAYEAPLNNSLGADSGRPSFPADNTGNDIDDLLKETSNFTVQNAISQPVEVNADSIDKLLSSSSDPGTKSKVMEDFDSWLDTI